MKDIFIKKHWDEENIIFYIHFSNEKAIRQIEESQNGIVLTSFNNPSVNNSMLFDQNIKHFEYDKSDIISSLIFEKKWKENDSMDKKR